ncbi:MAG: SagB/ThcOx family dehydrogenase [Nitrospirae bacterium]|nr:MAG: SagB/ThcOx family dehydrogenase [Nitrospirota bacterium]
MHDPKQLEIVLRYHQETKHHFNRYAKALGHLDWANQPNPFRRYDGAEFIRLPVLRLDEEPLSPPYDHLYRQGAVPSAPVTLRTLSRLLEYALALSAWKQAGASRWALRSNPSSGNLHPTEGYLLIGAVPGLAAHPGLYHYAPKEHGLERRTYCSEELFAGLMKEFPPQAFLVGFSSIHWREAWKYGERAFRYCQHDVGHAIGTARIAAATVGWTAVVLNGLSDATVEDLLGLNRVEDFLGAEHEHPDLLMVLYPTDLAKDWRSGDDRVLPLCVDPELARELTTSSHHGWQGKANRLSPDAPVPWEIIDHVAEASRKLSDDLHGLELAPPVKTPRVSGFSHEDPSAGRIIHQRRSLLACDGKTSIPAERFYTMLARVMPRVELDVLRRPMPWDALPWDPTIHLGLFVHRVDGLAPGLYALARNPAKVDKLRKAMHEQFAWTTPPGCPADLPLYLLEEGNAQRIATQVSCFQEIAGDGAFSLGMIADYQASLVAQEPWFYRRLFWETGVIGQVLYLEAEAAGVRATGIGCFFDDPVHETFGFKDLTFQSLYHFTVGGAVDDPRLTTLPPYGD